MAKEAEEDAVSSASRTTDIPSGASAPEGREGEPGDGVETPPVEGDGLPQDTPPLHPGSEEIAEFDLEDLSELMGEGDDEFAVFDLSEIESQEIWQFKEVTAGELIRAAEPLPAGSPSPVEEETPGRFPPGEEGTSPPPPTFRAQTGTETATEGNASEGANTTPSAGETETGESTPPAQGEPSAETPTEPRDESPLPPGVAPEAVRVLEDLRQLGVDGAAETLERIKRGEVSPTTGGVEAPTEGVFLESAEAVLGGVSASPAGSARIARTRGTMETLRRLAAGLRKGAEAIPHLAARALLLLDRPFAGLNPRVKDFLGQVAISMLATAAFLLIMNALGLLPR